MIDANFLPLKLNVPNDCIVITGRAVVRRVADHSAARLRKLGENA